MNRLLIPGPEVPNFTGGAPRSIFDFLLDKGADRLVITLGDSWTWGDSLGDLSISYRSDHLYGRYISDHLDADWYNWGACGLGNGDILKSMTASIIELFPQMEGEIPYATADYYGTSHPLRGRTYDTVIFFLTLTETGRKLEKCEKDRPLEEIILEEERRIYDQLKFYDERFNLVVGRNFTVDLEETDNGIAVPKNWVEVNHSNDNGGVTDVSDILVSGPVTGCVFDDPIIQEHPNYKEYFVDQQSEKTGNLFDWLHASRLHNNIATCHPTEESHGLWGRYLMEHV